MPNEATWLSAYLPLSSALYDSETDHLVTSVLHPFVEEAVMAGWIDQYFFVRYSEGGPHLRLRVRGAPQTLDAVVAPALQTLWAGRNAGLPCDDGSAILRSAVVRLVPYEPELDRYGGIKAIAVAEEGFWISSRCAFELIRSTMSGRPARLGQALLTMLVFIHVFGEGRTNPAVFAARYAADNLRPFARDEVSGDAWIRTFDDGYAKQSESVAFFVKEAWARLTAEDELSPALDELRKDLVGLREKLRVLCESGETRQYGKPVSSLGLALISIVPSYIHMMNNRLGLSIPDEAYIAHVLSRSLSSPVIKELSRV